MLAESLTARYSVIVWLSCDQAASPAPTGRGFVIGGGEMPELVTIEEIDQALARARAVPEDERNEMWHVIVDALLERRNELAGQ